MGGKAESELKTESGSIKIAGDGAHILGIFGRWVTRARPFVPFHPFFLLFFFSLLFFSSASPPSFPSSPSSFLQSILVFDLYSLPCYLY